MDLSRAMLVVDQLFSDDRTEVSRDDIHAAADRANLDSDTRTDFHSLTRDRYTKQQLTEELRGMGRNTPIGAGGGLGGAG